MSANSAINEYFSSDSQLDLKCLNETDILIVIQLLNDLLIIDPCTSLRVGADERLWHVIYFEINRLKHINSDVNKSDLYRWLEWSFSLFRSIILTYKWSLPSLTLLSENQPPYKRGR